MQFLDTKKFVPITLVTSALNSTTCPKMACSAKNPEKNPNITIALT